MSYPALAGYLRDLAGRRFHYWLLAGSSNMGLQFGWAGAFLAAAMGTHYVIKALTRRYPCMHRNRRAYDPGPQIKARRLERYLFSPEAPEPPV